MLTPGVKKEESSGHTGGEAGEGEDKDDEFARIMAKLNELEMEEEQEEGEDEDDGSKEHDVEESEQDIVKGLGDKPDDNRIGSVLDKVSGHSSSIGPKPQYLQKGLAL